MSEQSTEPIAAFAAISRVQKLQPSYHHVADMSTSHEDGSSSSTGLDTPHTLPKVSLQDDRSNVSSPGSASEQSEMHNTAKFGRLSRRATFAPGVSEALNDGAMQPLILRLPSVAKQPSIPKQSSVIKQSGVVKQSSMATQSSIPKQSSMHKQPSIAGQARSVSQTNTPRGRSADLSRAVSLSSRKSIETDKMSAQRSSSILQSRKSLQSMKTAKIDDMLDDYKFAVERKAKPAEVHAGQHALELDAAMQKLTLDWIVQSIVSLSLNIPSALSLLKHGLLLIHVHWTHVIALYLVTLSLSLDALHHCATHLCLVACDSA